jgi:organic hydroperoxide reductase OsmC/OhrA
VGGSGGPGTDPEQLFATGCAACFQGALLRIAAGRMLDLCDSRITGTGGNIEVALSVGGVPAEEGGAAA